MTLIKPRQEFNDLSWWGKLWACFTPSWAVKWDMHFENIPAFEGCEECDETNMLGGKCYDRFEINYILFGMMGRLCDMSQTNYESLIAAWKKFGVPVRDVCNGERPRDELTETLLALALRGYMDFGPDPVFGEEYLVDLPDEPRFKKCRDCGEEWTQAMDADWP